VPVVRQDAAGGVAEDKGSFEDALNEIDAAGLEDAGISAPPAPTSSTPGEPPAESRHGLDLTDPISAWVEDLFNQPTLTPSAALTGEPADDLAAAPPAADGGQAAPADEPASSTPDGALETAPTAPPAATPAPTITLRGVEFTEDQILAALATNAQFEALPQRTREEFNAYLAGQFDLVPRGVQVPTAQVVEPPAPTPEPVDWEDPEQVAATVQQLQERLERAERVAGQTLQSQAARLNQERVDAVNAAVEHYKTQTGITDEPVIAAVMSRAGMFAQQIAQANPDAPLPQVFYSALQEASWNVPEARAKLLELEAQARIDSRQDELAQASQRKARNAALTGSPSGSLPRTAAPQQADPRTQTQAQRDAAMLQTVQRWMTGS
jgi:hypothetical protein